MLTALQVSLSYDGSGRLLRGPGSATGAGTDFGVESVESTCWTAGPPQADAVVLVKDSVVSGQKMHRIPQIRDLTRQNVNCNGHLAYTKCHGVLFGKN